MRWPIDHTAVTRVGQGVMDDRDGDGRPHKGVDLFAPAGTEVTSPIVGRVIRVVDGRSSDDLPKRRAGLWVDVEETGKRRIHRFLHLGTADVKAGDRLTEGQRIGTVAEANTSGLGDATHLHYEVREWGTADEAYGAPIDPRPILADVLTAKAERIIPGMVRATGTASNPRWQPVGDAILVAKSEADPDKRLELAGAALTAAYGVAKVPGVAGKQAQMAQLLDLDTAALRKRQDDERQLAEAAARKAGWQSSMLDLAVGRPRQYKLHLEEGARAFAEGESASDEKTKRQWYARAVLEYRDARQAAGDDLAEGPSIVQTAKAGVKKGAELGKEGLGVLWETIPTWAKVAGAGVLGLTILSAVTGGGRRDEDEDDDDDEEDDE